MKLCLVTSSSFVAIATALAIVGCSAGEAAGTDSQSGSGSNNGSNGNSSTSNGSSSSSNNGNNGNSGSSSSSSSGVPSYNVDESQTSVSGISSGGFMAVQFHIAFSSIMKGAAVFAGGPYSCAQGQLTNAEIDCQYPTTAPSVTPFVTLTNQYFAAGSIDDPKNLTNQHVFLFGGANDYTVNPVVMDSLSTYYGNFMSPSNVKYENRHANTGHTMPTMTYGNSCSETASPWIGACAYDGAGTALSQIYGELSAAATTLSGSYITIPQGNFLANPSSHSIADSGYAYVPASCAGGDSCKIHVAFHGCEQQASGSVGDVYYKNAGYNEWADTNHIIVLYPQTTTSSGTETNPNACWDWWGYDSADYAKQTGPQMAMVKKMIDTLAGK